MSRESEFLRLNPYVIERSTVPNESESTIALGDTCVLRSGSPVMTATAADGDSVTCTWFSQGRLGGGLAEQSFPRAALRRVEKEE